MKRCLTGAKRNRNKPAKGDYALAEAALLYAYGPVLRRLRANPTGGRLGFSRPSYNTACVRGTQLLQQLCEEIGEHWWQLIDDNAKAAADDWKRVDRVHREDAAVELMLVVRGLPAPVRRVVELRAVGLSWRDIAESLPDRVHFSIVDDWNAALRLLMARHEPLLRRVA